MNNYSGFPALLVQAVLLSFLSACASSRVGEHFWEIPDPYLPYIAMIRTHPGTGTAVLYNPDLCYEIGAACQFFRVHAHAHLLLNHLILATPEDYPASQEAAADCMAARNIEPEEVIAVVAFLLDKDRDPAIPLTGNPKQRAEHIQQCAMAAGNWVAK